MIFAVIVESKVLVIVATAKLSEVDSFLGLIIEIVGNWLGVVGRGKRFYRHKERLTVLPLFRIEINLLTFTSTLMAACTCFNLCNVRPSSRVRQ